MVLLNKNKIINVKSNSDKEFKLKGNIEYINLFKEK